jgi:hypothetical protein
MQGPLFLDLITRYRLGAFRYLVNSKSSDLATVLIALPFLVLSIIAVANNNCLTMPTLALPAHFVLKLASKRGEENVTHYNLAAFSAISLAPNFPFVR